MSPFVPRFTVSLKLYMPIGQIAVGIGGLWKTSASLVHKAPFERPISRVSLSGENDA